MAAAIFAAFWLAVPPVAAAWDPDGLPVCTADDYQGSLVAVPDEVGGMLMVWQDHRDMQLKIYAQRVTENGTLLWTTNGVLVGGSQSFHPWICADGAGGAWVVFNPVVDGYGEIYVRHIDASGSVGSIIEIAGGSVWSHNTLPVCVTDGAGGVIAAWVQEIDPPSGDLQIVAQRVSAAGTTLWGTQGVLVYFEIGAGEELSMAADDGCHGTFIGWKTSTGAGSVQRLDANGIRCFNGSNGYGLGLLTPGSRVRVADRVRSSGGCFIAYEWHHTGSGVLDYDALSVEAVDSTGYQFWTEVLDQGGGGMSVPPPGDDFRIVDNGMGGVDCVWDIIEVDEGRGIYTQCVDDEGNKIWNGGSRLRISEETDGNYLADAATDGNHGLYVSWVDASDVDPFLRFARIEYSLGVVMNRRIVPGGNSDTRPCVVSNGTWSAKPLISWIDYRPGDGETDIYATGLSSSGLLLHPNLVATRLTPAEPYGTVGGDPHSFFVMVKNLGSCASDSFWTTVFPNQTMPPKVGDLPGSNVQSFHNGPLAAYDSVLVEILVDAPENPITWSMWGFADYLGEIYELDQEDDNVVGPVPYEWIGLPNLEITNVWISNPAPYPTEEINFVVTVKNTGTETATGPIECDHWVNRASTPPEGATGDQRISYGSIDPGDSIVWVTSLRTSETFLRWTSWFRVDTRGLIDESNEGDNLSGPHTVDWQVPPQDGWPVLAGAGFHSSPAIAEIDGDPRTLEVVIGCDDGKLFCLDHEGEHVYGWPVQLPDSIFSSPAVGDITGDSRNEIIVGCDDGLIYAFDCFGSELWNLDTGSSVRTTPTLADLDDDDKLEVICGSQGYMYALTGTGGTFGAGWPVDLSGAIPTSTAVGDVDGNGSLEIAFAVRSKLAPASMVHLRKSSGASFSASWPVTADTIIVAAPALGSIALPSSSLEIVAAGLNGTVYAWNYAASAWPDATPLPGSVETAPALYHNDKDGNLEVAAGHRQYTCSGYPPRCGWRGYSSVVDDLGGIVTGWPRLLGTWSTGGIVPSPIVIGVMAEVMAGSPSDLLYSMRADGTVPYGFPLDIDADVITSAAAGDLDGDGWIELVQAVSSGTIRCYKLRSTNYTEASLVWPMLGHDRARTHCYGFIVPTDTGDIPGIAPAASAIRSIYPNPFNPSTRIFFDVAHAGRVTLSIFDVAGRRVAVLFDGRLEPGRFETEWNGTGLSGETVASGVYFCRLQAGSAVETRKMILLR